jgi:SNARE protein
MIDDFQAEITNDLDILDKDITAYPKLDAAKKVLMGKKIKGKQQQIRMSLDSYDLEINSIDRIAGLPHKEKLSNLRERFTRLQTACENLKSDDKAKLFNTLVLPVVPPPPKLQEMTSHQLIELGTNLQDKGLAGLERTRKEVFVAHAIADDVNVELKTHIEALDRQHTTISETKQIITRANEYLKFFAKQIFTDKILVCLMLIVAGAIVAIIILKATGITATNRGSDVLRNA